MRIENYVRRCMERESFFFARETYLPHSLSRTDRYHASKRAYHPLLSAYRIQSSLHQPLRLRRTVRFVVSVKTSFVKKKDKQTNLLRVWYEQESFR